MSESSALSDLIGTIYDAALDPTLWIRTLEQSCDFVGGSSAALYWHDTATVRAQALYLIGEDPHYTKLYFEKYLSLNPTFPAAAFVEPGVIFTPTDIVPESELVKTRFHREWVQPQGIVDVIGVNLEKGTTASSLFNIRRTHKHGVADAGARERTALLVPHFQRAVAIGRLFQQASKAEAVLTETLDLVEAAVFLVGVNGRISFANGPGRAMLEEGTLLRERRNMLTAVAPESNRMLREIFIAAEDGDTSVGNRGVAIPLASSPHQRWFAHVLPLTSGDRSRNGSLPSAVAAVFVRKTSPVSPPPLEALANIYKLTASELRVLDAMTKVSSVRAASELLGIAQATVKTHLHNLFRKTGSHRQSDLVKLMAGFEPPPPSS
ncbi:transcriptional regulator, LuxR family [Rhodopseudomonas palustris HaA2]|uniref:Transcriptional regulator, LuxR family n=1 Tax=Rhodopseudomonas palustris (strain HaA2) TaxID=316058 RepID=Q2IWB4_RHOP2|nr:helix-turn-helix transcriptional regulator [Rhodopseudomonas palustris]ABD07496.1 transcriptional regulator, LuxR family [Rhodopseudomonas palustris HaA2]